MTMEYNPTPEMRWKRILLQVYKNRNGVSESKIKSKAFEDPGLRNMKLLLLNC